ncbi:MAG: MFS transporter [Candidatus Sumerlaeota bacterium]|nr:MFS transporter [Candidatus Sumerlaeota bacterium]
MNFEKLKNFHQRWPLARALRHRNYQLYFFGQGISLIGTWMQRVAQGWLIYEMRHSGFLLGLVSFCSMFPTFVVTPWAGVWADKGSLRRVLVITQMASMIQALALAVLTLTGAVEIWHIVALSALLGVTNAIDIPIRHSFVVEMLETRDDLPNALALNSMLFNSAKLVGPSLAGGLIYLMGAGMCFLLNGLSFIAVIAALMAMRLKPAAAPARSGPSHAFQRLKEGFLYTFGFAPTRAILLLLGAMNLLATPYLVLMPVFAKDILKGGPGTLGFLTAAPGIGAIVGGLLLASRRSVLGFGRVIAVSAGLLGAAVIAFSQSTNLTLSLFLLVFAGLGMMTQMVASNTLLQTIVDDHMRGRLMSFYTISFMGTAPFGGLLGGALVGRIGAPATLAWTGAGCVAAALLFAWGLPALGRAVHPVYIRKGIVPAFPLDENGEAGFDANGIAIAGDGNSKAPAPLQPKVRF